jgi:Family of unknown function (DUF6331)
MKSSVTGGPLFRVSRHSKHGNLFDEHVPKATWFWSSLEQHCVVECCGLEAYEFSHEAIREACRDHVDSAGPGPALSRDLEPGDPLALADSLVALAAHLRTSTAKAVSAQLFDDVLPPESYAELFDDLAWKLRNRLPAE